VFEKTTFVKNKSKVKLRNLYVNFRYQDQPCISFVYINSVHQGCQMVYFRTKNPDLGKFLRALDWKIFIHFMDVQNILQIFGDFYDHLVHFVLIWYMFSGFGITYQ
jgi:hypothetical protein